MKIVKAAVNDIPELYRLQLLAFESEAEMIGSRNVPALLETREDNEKDFMNWSTLKLLDGSEKVTGAIRYRESGGVIEVGRLMIHPDHRRQGYAKLLMSEVDLMYPDQVKELYTCTKSWINIRLYEKMGYVPFKTVSESSGLSFVYMRKS